MEFLGLFTRNLDKIYDPIEPRVKYKILEYLLGEKEIIWISGTAIPSIPLIETKLEKVNYFMLPKLGRAVDSLFKFLSKIRDKTIVLDNFSNYIREDFIGPDNFFKYLFKIIKESNLSVILLADGVLSDQDNCEGMKKIIAPWYYFIIDHGRSNGIKVRFKWIIRPRGFRSEGFEKMNFKLLETVPVKYDEENVVYSKMLAVGEKVEEVEDRDIGDRIINSWTTNMSRYQYVAKSIPLYPTHSKIIVEYPPKLVKTRPNNTVKKSYNIMKYICTQKQFKNKKLCKYLSKRRIYEKSINETHDAFMTMLGISLDMRNEIGKLSGGIYWLIPFLSLFTHHWDIQKKKDVISMYPKVLEFPQISNWLGGYQSLYFKNFDAKKAAVLSKKLAISLFHLNDLLGLGEDKVDQYLEKKEDCSLVIKFYDDNAGFCNIKLPFFGEIKSYFIDIDLSSLPKNWVTSVGDSDVDSFFTKGGDKIYPAKLLDMSTDWEERTTIISSQLPFTEIKIYIEELDGVLNVKYHHDGLSKRHEYQWKLIRNNQKR